MSVLNYINWNADPEIVNILGYSLRYYSLLFVGGVLAGAFIIFRILRREGVSEDNLVLLEIYGLLGIVFGARLGHCLFYEPLYYLQNPLEMLLPIRQLPQGGWQFTGYHGLASHGGAIGLLFVVWLYARRTKQSYFHTIDLVAMVTPLTGVFIRTANLMNSEIIGCPTEVPWAFIFERVDMIPRHPTQIYEALCYLTIFLCAFGLYRRFGRRLRDGFYLGFSITLIFSARFVLEFIKEKQVEFEESMTFDMGQWLSVPFIVLGIGLLIWTLRQGIAPVAPEPESAVNNAPAASNQKKKSNQKR